MVERFIPQDLGGIGRLVDQINFNRQQSEREKTGALQRRDLELGIEQQESQLADIAADKQFDLDFSAAFTNKPQDVPDVVFGHGVAMQLGRPDKAQQILEVADKNVDRLIELGDVKGATDFHNQNIAPVAGFTVNPAEVSPEFGQMFDVTDTQGNIQKAAINEQTGDIEIIPLPGGATIPEKQIKVTPQTDLGKINADLKAGFLSQEDVASLKTKTSDQDTFERALKLRKDFVSQSGEFIKQRDSFGRIEASASDPSAAGDLALIFNYMKLLDPGSVVRESEFATASNAGGVDDRTRALYNRVLSGQRLSDDQRIDFVNRANKLFDKSNLQHDKRISETTRIAERFNIDPQDVIIDVTAAVEGGEQNRIVIPDHPTLGNITEADITETMRANNMTRDQVIQQLGAQ